MGKHFLNINTCCKNISYNFHVRKPKKLVYYWHFSTDFKRALKPVNVLTCEKVYLLQCRFKASVMQTIKWCRRD